MFKDRKLKKYFKKEMKPDISFETFCKQNNIPLEQNWKDKEQKGDVIARSHNALKIWLPILALFVIAICIIIPYYLSIKTPFEPKRYGEEDVSGYNTTIDQVKTSSDIKLFDLNKTEEIGSIYIVKPNDDDKLILSYMFDEVILGFSSDKQFYAYKFSYIVRTYDNYFFMGCDNFLNFSKNTVSNDINFSYKIVNGVANATAYLFFEKNNYDYFLTLKSFGGITEITNETVEAFITNAF